MTGIIVTLLFIVGIILFVLFGRYISNKSFETPKWFVTLKDKFGSAVSVIIVIAFLFIFFGIPILLIINGIPILLGTLF